MVCSKSGGETVFLALSLVGILDRLSMREESGEPGVASELTRSEYIAEARPDP